MNTWALSWFQETRAFFFFSPAGLIAWPCHRCRCPSCVWALPTPQPKLGSRSGARAIQEEAMCSHTRGVIHTQAWYSPGLTGWRLTSHGRNSQRGWETQHTPLACVSPKEWLSHRSLSAPNSKTPHVLLTAFLPEQAGGLKHPHQPGSEERGSAVWGLECPLPAPAQKCAAGIHRDEQTMWYCGMCALNLYFNVSNNLVVN